MTFIDFAATQAKQETHRIVHVKDWGGDVRLNRLGADDVLDIVEMQDEFEKDEDGTFLDQSQAMDFAVEFCAKTIANEAGVLQYDTPDGRDFLRLEFSAVQQLVSEATDLHRLNENAEQKKTE
jgi:hypothetical protein